MVTIGLALPPIVCRILEKSFKGSVMKTARNRFPWRPNEIATVAIAGLILLATGITAAIGILPMAAALSVVVPVGVIFAFAVYLGGSKKRKSTLYANMDPSNYRMAVWMKAPTRAIWGSKVDKGSNSAKNLDKFSLITLIKVGRNDVYQFTVDKRPFYLPKRIADEPEVASFLLDIVEKRNGNINAGSEETMKLLSETLNIGREAKKAS